MKFLKVILVSTFLVGNNFQVNEGKLFGDVFVTVTTPGLEGGEAIVDTVYLEPGFTAFETAEKFCREKDLDKAYSENKITALQDNKCVLPITYELQKSSRKLCFKNPKPVISFSIDITDDKGATRSETVRYCSGQTVFDASVSFCREHMFNDIMIGECQAQIETILSTKLNRMNDDAIVVASGTSSKVHIDMQVHPSDASHVQEAKPAESVRKISVENEEELPAPTAVKPKSTSKKEKPSTEVKDDKIKWLWFKGVVILSAVLIVFRYCSLAQRQEAVAIKDVKEMWLKDQERKQAISKKMNRLNKSKLICSPQRQGVQQFDGSGGSAPTPTASHSGKLTNLVQTNSKKTTSPDKQVTSEAKSDGINTNIHAKFQDPEVKHSHTSKALSNSSKLKPQMSPSRTLKDILGASSTNQDSQKKADTNGLDDPVVPPTISRIKDSPLPNATSLSMMSVSEVEAELNKKKQATKSPLRSGPSQKSMEIAIKEAVALAIKEQRAEFECEKRDILSRLEQAETDCAKAKESYTKAFQSAREASAEISTLNKKLEISALELRAAMTTVAQTQSDAKAQDHISYQLVQSLQKRAEVAERDLAIFQEKVGFDPLSSHSSAVSAFSHVSRRIGSAASSVTSDECDQSSLKSVSQCSARIVGSAASSVSGDDDHMNSQPLQSPQSHQLKTNQSNTPNTPTSDVLSTSLGEGSKGSGEKKKKLSQRARKARRQQYQQMLQQQKEEEEDAEEEDNIDNDDQCKSSSTATANDTPSSNQNHGTAAHSESHPLYELVGSTNSNRSPQKDKMKWGDSYDEEDELSPEIASISNSSFPHMTSVENCVPPSSPLLPPMHSSDEVDSSHSSNTTTHHHGQYRPSTPIAMVVDDVQIAQQMTPLDANSSTTAQQVLRQDSSYEDNDQASNSLDDGEGSTDGVSNSSGDNSPYSANRPNNQSELGEIQYSNCKELKESNDEEKVRNVENAMDHDYENGGDDDDDDDDYDGSMIIIGHSFDKHHTIQFEVRWEAEGEDAEDFWFSRSELFTHHREAVLDYEKRAGIISK